LKIYFKEIWNTIGIYGIAKGEMLDLEPSIPINFSDLGYSQINGIEWTDKIHLINK